MFKKFLKSKSEEIVMPISGEVIELEKVSDDVFSKKIMGDGVAIIPKDNIVYSPVSGKITQIFETKHAIIITSKEGTNILIHIGMDTVNMNGVPFETLVNEGKKVSLGEPIMKVDFDYIKNKELSTVTPVIIIESEREKKIVEYFYGELEGKKDKIMIVE